MRDVSRLFWVVVIGVLSGLALACFIPALAWVLMISDNPGPLERPLVGALFLSAVSLAHWSWGEAARKQKEGGG